MWSMLMVYRGTYRCIGSNTTVYRGITYLALLSPSSACHHEVSTSVAELCYYSECVY